MSRLMAEMMPLVIVQRSCSPSGLPMDTTSSPTCRELESPNSAGVRPCASILSTAMSLTASAPTSLPVYSVPSEVVTVTALAPSSTCVFVTM